MRFLAAPALMLAVGLSFLGGPALGAGKSREQRESEARKDCARGRVDQGIETLADLLTEYGHPNYIYNQARCYQQNGRAEQAISRFKEYLRVATDASADERGRVERFIHELEAEVQASAPPPATPPPPRIEAAPAAEPAAARPPETVEATRSEPAPATSSGTLRTTAIVLGAVGAAGLVTGLVSSLRVHSLNQQVESARVGQFDTDQLKSQGDKGHFFQKLQWVGYGIGGAALAGAVTCLILDGTRRSGERAGRVRLIGGLDRGGRPQLAIAGGF
jgi:hypothetical protein